jgi:hypothetical protein
MLFLRLRSSLTVAGETSNSTSKCSLSSIRDTGTKVIELTCSFLFLSTSILLGTFTFEVLFDKELVYVLLYIG